MDWVDSPGRLIGITDTTGEWFREECGVTFSEEIRPMFVHVVHKQEHD